MKRCVEGILLVCLGIGLGSFRDRALERPEAAAQEAPEQTEEHVKWTPDLRGDVNSDGRLNIADAVFILDYCFRSGPMPGPNPMGPSNVPVRIPQTTQQFCWSGTVGTKQDPCPGPGETDYGQDVNFKVGIERGFELIKEDESDANTWYTVDQATGLTWAYQSLSNRVGLEERLSWTGALKAAEDFTLGGFTDWRMPNIYELFTIVDVSRQDPSIDPDFFNLRATAYWSSSTCIFDTSRAYTVRFNSGFVNCNDKGGQGQGATRLPTVFVRTTNP